MNKTGRTQDNLFLGCHTNGKCIRQSTNRVMYGRERDRNKTKVEWKYLELLKIECLKKSPFDDELNVVKTLKETNRCMARKKENERMERRELFFSSSFLRKATPPNGLSFQTDWFFLYSLFYKLTKLSI